MPQEIEQLPGDPLMEQHEDMLCKDRISVNTGTIVKEIKWLNDLIDKRLAPLDDPGNTGKEFEFSDILPPCLDDIHCPYAALVKQYALTPADRLLLICSLMPHIPSELFTRKLVSRQSMIYTIHPEFGGYVDKALGYFIPTLKTILYILAGDNDEDANYYYLSLREKSKLFREQLITLQSVSIAEDVTNALHQVISLAPEYVSYCISGIEPRPDFGKAFPATLISTNMSWNDLVLHPSTEKHLDELVAWMKHGEELLRLDSIKTNHSFPCLFYGPPGTGKTLAAKLIGKMFNTMVFTIDLSMVVSKYIGETEKNLSYLFERAEGKNWILFFDEADALFGKRTNISDSKDKWANLEVSYLLQKMEQRKGLTILATNYKSNLDNALVRRFQSMIEFPYPRVEERARLWEKSIPAHFIYEPSISMDRLARFEITGAHIANVIKRCCVKALERKSNVIIAEDIVAALRRELAKESRTI